jgi:hypothetical protein
LNVIAAAATFIRVEAPIRAPRRNEGKETP